MISCVLIFMSAVFVCGVCIVLVFHRDYEDGILGRLALSMISISSFSLAMGIIERGFSQHLNPIHTIVWFALALFFGRHLYRFLRWRRVGENDWREADRATTAGKG